MAEMRGISRWMVNRRTEARARRALARLGSRLTISESSRVLELGSGGGGMLALLQERFHPARLIGTDYDASQVIAARKYLTTRWGALPETVQLCEADALQLPFPDGSFDAVFGMMMLHHVEANHGDYVRRPKAIREIQRVLKPGGELVYSEFVRRSDVRGTLAELGFTQRFLRSTWRTDTAIYSSPN